jgi:glycogen operon protein
MLLAGDELGRTQRNNNAYCQDNEISWIDWENADLELLQFTRKLILSYKSHTVFSRRRWFQGLRIKGKDLEDIAWFKPDGEEMKEENWRHDFAKSLAVYLNGRALHITGPKGEQLVDDSFYIIFNAHHGDMEFTLPPVKYGKQWTRILDTTTDVGSVEHRPISQEILSL